MDEEEKEEEGTGRNRKSGEGNAKGGSVRAAGDGLGEEVGDSGCVAAAGEYHLHLVELRRVYLKL